MSEVTPSPVSVEADVDQFKLVVVDISSHRREAAMDHADERLAEETGTPFDLEGVTNRRGVLKRIARDIWKPTTVKQIAKNAWKGNIAREFYRQKYYHQALREIDESGEVFVNQGVDSSDTLDNLIDRFSSEYDNEIAIHQEAGEKRTSINDDSDNSRAIKASIHTLIKDFAAGTLGADAFEEEKNRVLAQLAGRNPSKLGEGLIFADNLLEIAANIKAASEHGRSVQEILDSSDIVLGEARLGARTEARFNRVDKIVKKLHDTRIGSVVNENTLALAAGITMGVFKGIAQKGAAMAAAATGIFGLTGAGFGTLRESKRVREERALHMREMATGADFDRTGDGRRAEMDLNRYETIGAGQAINNLRSLSNAETGELNISDYAQYQAALTLLGNVSARIRMSDRQNIDLIHFSSLEHADEERFELDVEVAKARVALRSFLEAQDPETFLPPGLRSANFATLSNMVDNTITSQFSAEVEAKDVIFQKLRHHRMRKMGVLGFVIGTGAAVGMQEAISHIPGIGEHYYGIGEHSSQGGKDTLLHGVFGGHTAEAAAPAPGNAVSQHVSDHVTANMPHGASIQQQNDGRFLYLSPDGKHTTAVDVDKTGLITAGSKDALGKQGAIITTERTPQSTLIGSHEVPTGDGSRLLVPDGYKAQDMGNGHWLLTDAQGGHKTELVLGQNGSLTPESKSALEALGIHANTTPSTVTETTTTSGSTANELIWNNADQTKGVHRTLWYGNDTPGKYDLNELATRAGGVNGDWFDADGNVVLDITAMTKNGSFWHGAHADPFALVAEGKLKLGISLDKQSQGSVFDFTFKTTPDGRTIAIVPKDSPVYQLFEAGNQNNGHGNFNGRYIEVLQFMDQKDQGTGAEQVHVLGTYVGHNNTSNYTDIVETPRTISSVRLSIDQPPLVHETITFTAPKLEVQDIPVVAPLPIDLSPRTGLGKINPKNPEYIYSSYMSYERRRELTEDISPRLRRDPDAELDPVEELTWYRSSLRRRNGRDYLDQIDRAIDASDALRGLNGHTRAIVAIPVGAVAEADNIYRTLAIYARQQAEALEKTTFLLHVNWVNDAESDHAKKVKIDKTLAEIERAKADFGNLKIGTIQTVLDRGEVDAKGGLIGDVARKLYDTSLMCVERAIREGRISGKQEVLVIRNDADAKGLSRDYLGHMIGAADSKQESDAFVGAVRWETDTHGDYPGFGVVSNFREVMHAVTGRKSSTVRIPTIGINTAVRASMLAAISGVGFGKYVGAGSDDLEIGARLYAARSGIGSKSSRRRYSRLRGRTYRAPLGSSDEHRETIAYVRGAQIDSDAARLLNIYRSDGTINTAWNNFDASGHRLRDDVLGMDILQPHENPGDDPRIAMRVEKNISAMVNSWFPDRAHVRTGLRFMFPEKTKFKGKVIKVYNLSWTGGICDFEFTPEGAEWLNARLQRDTRGRYDPFGYRTRRKLYQEYDPEDSKRPNTVRPKMVTA